MKNKGFTLIELLAVIVILAVIALIATPMILNVIEGSKKGALKDSAYGLMESADIYYAEHTIDGGNKKTEFTFEEGIQTSVEQLGYKGRIEKGSLNLYSDGKVALCITDGKYAAIKNVNEEEVRISSGRCSYNEETEEYETVGICSDLESELEKVKEENNKKIEEIRNEYEERISNLTNDYEEQKRTIENTYKDQIEELNRRIEELENNKQLEIDQIRADYEAQVKTQQEAYEAQINELNRQLNTFKTGGTASASQILAGQTAFVKGSLITGSMKNNGAVNSSLNAGGSYTIPAGYHDGKGKVTANSLASQTQATATASDIASGKTAYVNGQKITGAAKGTFIDSFSTIDYPTDNMNRTVSFDHTFSKTPTVYVSSSMGYVKINSISTSSVNYSVTGNGTMSVRIFAYVQ